jgi:hypothetical protein
VTHIRSRLAPLPFNLSATRGAAPPRAAPLRAPAATVVRSRPAPHALSVPVSHEMTARDWWSLHLGHLRDARHLDQAGLARRTIAALDARDGVGAARLLRLFLSRVSLADGAACAALAMRYLQAERFDEALMLFRAARRSGGVRRHEALAMAHTLMRTGCAEEAIGLLAPLVPYAPADAHLRGMMGAAWLLRALMAAPTDGPGFAAARESAVTALQAATRLAPEDATLLDNLELARAVYAGPMYGNVGAELRPWRLDVTPALRPATLRGLERHARYVQERMVTIGRAVRVSRKPFERPENLAAMGVLARPQAAPQASSDAA